MSPGPDDPGINIPLPGLGGPDTSGPATPQPARPDRPALPTTDQAGNDLPPLSGSGEHAHNSRAFGATAFSFLTNRPAPGSGDRTAQMIAAFGRSPRDPARPDVAAAAQKMGVTRRSVQRWLSGGGMSRAHTDRLNRDARQAMTTKRGRAAVAKAQGPLRPPPGANGVTLKGVQGVVSDLAAHFRHRDTTVQLSEEDLDRLQSLWVEHGTQGVEAFMQQQLDRRYVSGWQVESMDDLGWTDTSNYLE